MISDVKREYMPYFSQTGVFPEEIDPIKLMKSDKYFRKDDAWKEYEDKCKTVGKTTNDDDETNQSFFTKDDLDKLGLVENTGKEDVKLLIFRLKKSLKKIAILFKKITYTENNIGIYYLLNIFDIDNLLIELGKVDNNENVIVDIIKDNIVNSDYVGDLESIYRIIKLTDNKKIDINTSKTLFIGNKDELAHGPKTFRIFTMSGDNTYLSSYIDNKDNNYTTELFTIDQYDNEIKRKTDFKFKLGLINSYTITSGKIWKEFINNTSVDIDEIKTFYSENKGDIKKILNNS